MPGDDEPVPVVRSPQVDKASASATIRVGVMPLSVQPRPVACVGAVSGFAFSPLPGGDPAALIWVQIDGSVPVDHRVGPSLPHVLPTVRAR